MFIYLVKVYLYDHNSFIGIVNFCQLNISLGDPGEITPFPPLSAPLKVEPNSSIFGYTEYYLANS